jgi:hypothetical protein
VLYVAVHSPQTLPESGSLSKRSPPSSPSAKKFTLYNVTFLGRNLDHPAFKNTFFTVRRR